MHHLVRLIHYLITITGGKIYWIFAGAILLTVTLGMFGFSSVFPKFSYLTRLYMTMQLFLTDSQSFDVSDELRKSGGAVLPWTLECAR